MLLQDMDDEVAALYRAYSFCKLFHCSLAEYEERPFKETEWMLQIDHVYHLAERDAAEKAAKQG